MMLADRYKTIRRGVTLVELLIVVSIMMLLAAVALPAMQTGMESRRIREAARAVHVYLGSAQVRALETGRPAGVLIERTDDNGPAGPAASILLRQVEVPPPYAGDFDPTALALQDWTHIPNQTLSEPVYWPGYHVVKAFVSVGSMSPGIVKRGNRVRLNYGGPLYTIVEDPWEQPEADYPVGADGYISFSSGGVLTLRVPTSELNNVPWPDYPTPASWPPSVDTSVAPWSNGVAFQITRDPVPSSVPPMGLPRGMVVDLADSGVGDGDWQSLVTGARIMFSPDGQVEQVYTNNLGYPVYMPIFLMIGRQDRIGGPNNPLPEDGLENWQDAANLWVALNPQSGRITVAEVSAEQAPGFGNNTTARTYVPFSVSTSRKYARQAQASMRGR